MKYLYQLHRGILPDYSTLPFYHYQCVFIHVPKTGGVSVAKGLFKNLGGGHRKALEYKEILGAANFKNFFKFGFTRHPVDRLYSAYIFLKNGGYDSTDKSWFDEHLAQFPTFSDFVYNWLNEDNIWRKNHFYPQFYFLCDENNELIVDFVGKYEQLEKDFTFIRKRLGTGKQLPHLNQTSNKLQLSVDLSTEIIARICKVYHTDFKLFHYK
ncbi:MAG: sulfotransferase family 2 domain-containing protein [Saprospiraceae bacterium]